MNLILLIKLFSSSTNRIIRIMGRELFCTEQHKFKGCTKETKDEKGRDGDSTYLHTDIPYTLRYIWSTICRRMLINAELLLENRIVCLCSLFCRMQSQYCIRTCRSLLGFPTRRSLLFRITYVWDNFSLNGNYRIWCEHRTVENFSQNFFY